MTLFQRIRLLAGQYSAYSSQVQPTRVQHSDVMDPSGIRRRPRRVRNIVLAVSSSSQGSESGQMLGALYLVNFPNYEES